MEAINQTTVDQSEALYKSGILFICIRLLNYERLVSCMYVILLCLMNIVFC